MSDPEWEKTSRIQPSGSDAESLPVSEEVTTPLGETKKAVTHTITIERLQDPLYLPSRKDVIDAFEAANHGAWGNFQWENPHMQEILTSDYINALADYLIERLDEMKTDELEPMTILELAAGDGRLSHFIRERLKEKGYDENMIKVVATDERAWSEDKNPFPVELPFQQTTPYLDQDFGIEGKRESGSTEFNKDMLKKHKPKIVITSWPPITDLTADIRVTDSVEEYIVIGQEETCGDDWSTFGLEFASPEPNNGDLRPPFEEDGFQKINLKNLSDLQITRADEYGPGKGWNHDQWGSRSMTQAFMRSGKVV